MGWGGENALGAFGGGVSRGNCKAVCVCHVEGREICRGLAKKQFLGGGVLGHLDCVRLLLLLLSVCRQQCGAAVLLLLLLLDCVCVCVYSGGLTVRQQQVVGNLQRIRAVVKHHVAQVSVQDDGYSFTL